jgi:hypothetical protein
MSDEKAITTVAFRRMQDCQIQLLTYHLLPFPQEWKSRVAALQREASPTNSRWVSPPIKSLNSALRALIPDLVGINRNAAKDWEKNWLIAKRPIDIDALFLIIKAWFNAEFANASASSRDRVRATMKLDDLVWRETEIDLSNGSFSPPLANGTSNPNSLDYAVLPNQLAWAVESTDDQIELGSEPIPLRRMALEPGASGAELVSWPPHQGCKGKWTGLFSYTFRFTLQTVAFLPEPLVYLHIGIRRWVTEPTGIGTGTSVVVDASVPWLKKIEAGTSLAGTSVRCLPASQDFRLEYRDRLPEILGNLMISGMPDPNQMKDDPETSLTSTNGIRAGFVFSERMKRRHPIGTGVSADERRKLAEQIAPLLEQQGFEMLEPLRKARQRSLSVRNPFFPTSPGKRKDELPANHEARKAENAVQDCVDRSERVCAVAKGSLQLEVFFQSSPVLSALQSTIIDCLGQPTEQGQTAYEWTFPTGNVVLTWQNLGELGRKLNLPSGRSNTADQLAEAYSSRVKEFRQTLTHCDAPVGTIVELAGGEAFHDRPEEDPKSALRVAFASTGRLTQFITPAEGAELLEGPVQRAKASWYDLFRQLGVSVSISDLESIGLPRHVRVVGVWLIKRTNQNSATKREGFLPVAVYWDSRDDVVYAMVNGVKDLLTYPEALLSVGRGEGKLLDNAKQSADFIRDLLDELKGGGDTLVVCDKQNLGSGWNWLYNNQIQQDVVAFGKELNLTSSQLPGIRIVRVRNEASSNETPEWYRTDGEKTRFAKGLWRVSDRVFGSTYGKPAQAKNACQYTSKIAPWMNDKRVKVFDPKPEDNLPNPAFYELTSAFLQPNDEPAAWANLAHVLRDLAVHYNDAVSRPFPLLLAERIEEYTIPFDMPSTAKPSEQRRARTANS